MTRLILFVFAVIATIILTPFVLVGALAVFLHLTGIGMTPVAPPNAP